MTEVTPPLPADSATRPPRRRRFWGLLLVVASVAGAGLVLSVGLGRDPLVVRSVLLGRPAPALAGSTLTGEQVDLRNYRGKIVLVNIWASWCVPCQRESPVLAATQRDLGPLGVQLLGVNMRDKPADARAFIRKFHVSGWPSIADPDATRAVAWGTFALPETYLVDRDGTILKKAVGAVTQQWISQNVVPLVRNS